MNADRRKKRYWLLILLVPVIVVIAVVALQWSHANVIPDPPTGETVAVELPATTSHLSVAINGPKSAIAAQLENAIPKTFQLDVNSGGARAYGSPSRGPINVVIDVAAKRASVAAPVSGKVQVEKRVKIDLLLTKIDQLASVGIDTSGVISASFSPVIATNWTVDPRLGLSVHVDKAIASAPAGGIDVTGHVQGAVASALNGVKATAESKLKESLDVRQKVERLWNEMNSVQKLTDNPPTWLRITPRQATFGQFHFANDSIDSSLGLDLETRVFLQDTPPDALNSPLSDLRTAGTISDEFELSIPVEVSYAVINQQLKTLLTKSPIDLPQNASVAITDATIAPYGDGILMTVDFSGRKGWFKSASGRLYVVGVPVFDISKAELRLDKLEFTAATKSILVKTVDWLAHASLLEAMKSAAVVKLDPELTKAKKRANEELEILKTKLPKEVGADLSVKEISVDRLAFAEEWAFVVVKAKGKMSAQLKP